MADISRVPLIDREKIFPPPLTQGDGIIMLNYAPLYIVLSIVILLVWTLLEQPKLANFVIEILATPASIF